MSVHSNAASELFIFLFAYKNLQLLTLTFRRIQWNYYMRNWKTSLILHNCELGKYTQTIESIYAEHNDHISLEYALIPIKINLHIELESSINFVNAIFIQIFTFFSKKISRKLWKKTSYTTKYQIITATDSWSADLHWHSTMNHDIMIQVVSRHSYTGSLQQRAVETFQFHDLVSSAPVL